MSFFLHLKTQKTYCINGCTLFNDLNEFSYWEDKEATNDEKYILNYLKSITSIDEKKILHIGIGNSYIANNLNNFYKIDGISISKNELDFAKKQNTKNYNVYFQNKFSRDNLLNSKLKFYDIIIDVNLKSFSCCDKAFNKLFELYKTILNNNGILITGRAGMKWSRKIRPVLSFSLKKLFYKRLKEFDGPKSNLLSENDCLDLCNKHNLKLNKSDNNLIIFKKLS